MSTRMILYIVAGAIIITLIIAGIYMGKFKLFTIATNADTVGKYVIFSPVNGTVTLNGATVVGARVERTHNAEGKAGGDETVTDGKGLFHLDPLYTGWSISHWIPHEVIIRQTINIYYQGSVYKIWDCRKGNYILNSELGGRDLNLDFKLELEPQRINPVCVGMFVMSEGR